MALPAIALPVVLRTGHVIAILLSLARLTLQFHFCSRLHISEMH